MWIRRTDGIVKQIEANNLANPVHPGSPSEDGLIEFILISKRKKMIYNHFG